MNEHFKDALLFGKENTITLEEVQASIRIEGLQKFQEFKGKENGLSLNVSNSKGKKTKQFSLDDMT